jgi:hypothetical protein
MPARCKCSPVADLSLRYAKIGQSLLASGRYVHKPAAPLRFPDIAVMGETREVERSQQWQNEGNEPSFETHSIPCSEEPFCANAGAPLLDHPESP